jgi:hypothetical protein
VFRGYLCFLWIKPLRTSSLFAESNVALDQGLHAVKNSKRIDPGNTITAYG